jgi:hypothetical protein
MDKTVNLLVKPNTLLEICTVNCYIFSFFIYIYIFYLKTKKTKKKKNKK